METKKEVLDRFEQVVVRFDEEAVDGLCRKALDMGIDSNEAILNGLSRGMREVGDLYDKQEYGIPELLLCADVLNRGVDILKPHIMEKATGEKVNCRIVIGTVEVDIHCIGKNIVKLMLSVGGFEVVDLGNDVVSHRVIEEGEA